MSDVIAFRSPVTTRRGASGKRESTQVYVDTKNISAPWTMMLSFVWSIPGPHLDSNTTGNSDLQPQMTGDMRKPKVRGLARPLESRAEFGPGTATGTLAYELRKNCKAAECHPGEARNALINQFSPRKFRVMV